MEFDEKPPGLEGYVQVVRSPSCPITLKKRDFSRNNKRWNEYRAMKC